MRTKLSILTLALCSSSAAAFALPVQDTEAPPVCVNGGPYVVECTGPVTQVTVDGSGSFDPNGTDLAFQWFEECTFGFFEDPTAASTNFVMDNSGVCTRTCVVVLRVTSGGQTVPCQTTITVQDTTAPVLTCPPDVIEVWNGGPPAQIDPILTGFATASDCDPFPVITYSDTFDPGNAPGEPETIVTRTWVAIDFCNNQSSCVQTITLLSPSGGFGAYVDFLGGSCPNQIDVSDQGVLTVTVFGTTALPVSQIVPSSLFLTRTDNAGGVVKRSICRTLDVGRPKVGSPCECDSNKADGLMDLKLTYAYPQIVTDLAFNQELPGSSVEVALVGKLTNGSWIVVRDCVSVQ